jgi:7-cyano-7-deazaguanine synthase in queuosine biosynthesis
LTEDIYEFRFTKNPRPTEFERFLGFGDDNPEGIERIVLFSGGIDSLTGAVEDTLGNGRKVALVSHCPVSHLGSRQDHLATAIAGRIAATEKRPLHLKVLANKIGTFDHEHTQRSRSFLFSSIAAVVARVFGLNAIEFYENGVISVNLPLCEQEKNARGSRTTHPQALHRIGELLSHIAGQPFAVSNHYLACTKQDVVERLVALGHADLLLHSISCTHTRGFTQEKPHCGLCPQCLSRKFATAGAGLDEYDPDTKYRTDVFLGNRPETPQRTLAERFVGNARQIERMTDPLEFQRLFTHEIGRVTPYLPGSSRDVVASLFDLHHRHATQVGRVVEDKMKHHIAAYRQETLSRTSTLWFAFATANTSQQHDGQPKCSDAEVVAQVRLLNEMQRHIIQALSERDITDPDIDKLPGQPKVAELAGYTYDTSLKNALTALVKAQLLDNGKHHGRRGGYFLTERGLMAAQLLEI